MGHGSQNSGLTSLGCRWKGVVWLGIFKGVLQLSRMV